MHRLVIAAYILILGLAAFIQYEHTENLGRKNAEAIAALKNERVKRTAEIDTRIDELTVRVDTLEESK